ncbi:MAG: hypothetical protein K8T89_20930 [Planctomycetes bacterium]|nr:hypothetical protein [Planctomycetota bacterium]
MRKVRVGSFLDNDDEETTMAKSEKILTAVVRDRAVANRTYDWLQSRGYAPSEISVLMSDKTRASYDTTGTEGKIKSSDKSIEGVATGGTIGTVVGATLGALLAIGTSVVVPGLGLVVAGPILAGLAGGGAGAVTGGLVGGLVGLGIPESNAKAYEEALNSGGVVFGVMPRNSKDGEAMEEYLKKSGGENIVYADRA